MANASGSRHSMGYILEVTPGVTPATPAFQPIRHVTTNLALTKQSVTSAEIRSDRQITDVRHGNYNVAGDVVGELSLDTYEDILEAVFCSAWAPSGLRTATTISALSTDDSFNDSANGFLTSGFRVGHRVSCTGFATGANNIVNGVISSVTAGKMVISGAQGAAIVTEAAGTSRTITSLETTLKGGTTRRTFTIERRFLDIVQYLRYKGCEFDKMALSFKPNAMVSATFGIVGRTQDPVAQAIIAGATYPAATTSSPMDSFSGTVSEGGVATALVTEVSLDVVNGISPMFALGSRGAVDTSIGRFQVNASASMYFADAVMLNKFINETESTLVFDAVSPTGTYRFTLPRVKYNGGQPDVGGEGPVILSMPLVGLYDATSASSLQIERIPA